jgi:hypothetical protein
MGYEICCSKAKVSDLREASTKIAKKFTYYKDQEGQHKGTDFAEELCNIANCHVFRRNFVIISYDS